MLIFTLPDKFVLIIALTDNFVLIFALPGNFALIIGVKKKYISCLLNDSEHNFVFAFAA